MRQARQSFTAVELLAALHGASCCLSFAPADHVLLMRLSTQSYSIADDTKALIAAIKAASAAAAKLNAPKVR